MRGRKTWSPAKPSSTSQAPASPPRRVQPPNELCSTDLARTRSSTKRILSDSQAINHPSPSAHRPSPPLASTHHPSPHSTPTRSEHDRKSFQGDHHRHRYMSYSASPSSLRPSPQSRHSPADHRARPSPSQRLDAKSPRPSPKGPSPQPSSSLRSPGAHPPRAPRLLNPTTQHLGAPINAHYSPHYGSPAQRVPTSKRKPPPPISSVDASIPTGHHSPVSSALTPQTASPRSQHSCSRSADPSPSRSHRKLTKSRSPSPSPRSGGLAKIIGSVLTAPFRSSNSRRGSDASEIGLGIHDVARMEPNSLSLTTDHSPSPQPAHSERLPFMPSAASSSPGRSSPCGRVPSHLTVAQQIIHETRSREAMSVVPESPERVLRVVNGTATTSTKASSVSRKSLDGVFQPSSGDNTRSLSINRDRSRASFPASSVYCSKCIDLESQLTNEVNRSRALERALEEQITKLEQLRNWSTAKVTTLDHALQAQERMLQEVEKRIYENNEKPDIQSDYLIALQKDFIELNARLATLEAKKAEDDGEAFSAPPGDSCLSNSQSSCETHDSPSTRPTSLGRITPSSGLSPLPQAQQTYQSYGSSYAFHDREMCRAYSTPPLKMNKTESGKHTPEMMTPRKPITPWKPSSPATLASKLVPPTLGGSPRSPASNNCRSAPATPNSRSPRPRYTSALGVKAPSPLGFNSTGNRKSQDQVGHIEAIKQVQSGGISPTPTGGPKSASDTPITARYRKPFEVLSQTTGQGLANSSVPSNVPWKANRFSSPASKYSNIREAVGSSTPNFHSKRMSVINQLNQNLCNFSPSLDAVPTKPLAIGHQKKPVVGDLIKMFDGPK